jgi:flagellar hook-associated protein 2
MSSMYISGLVSGLNTQQIISSLMQAEAIPQQQLQQQLSTEQGIVSAYQGLNTQCAAIGTAAGALTSGGTAWAATAATSSSSTVTATSTSGAMPGQLTFDVTQVAQAHDLVTAQSADLTTSTTFSTGPIQILDQGGAVKATVTPTDGSMQSVIDAVNSATQTTGVQASALQVAPGQYRLQLQATTTGASSAFSLSGLTGAGGLQVLRQGQDAAVSLGAGVTATSSTNNFTGVLPGVTFTVQAPTTGVTITVARDPGAMADKVQALVDAANSALSAISTQTAYDPATKTGGPLLGDLTAQELSQNLMSTVSSPSSGTSLGTFGIQLNQSGQLVFDRAGFLAAYAQNPSGAQAAVSAFSGSVQAVANGASDPVSGSITTAIQGANSLIQDLNDSIATWDQTLAARKATLETQFANLETTMGQLKAQSSWLSAQLAGLTGSSPSSSSSSSGGA